MERRLRGLLVGVALVFAVCCTAPFVVGAMLPVEHTVTRSAVINKHPKEVWGALAAIDEAFTDLPISVVEEAPPKRRVTRLGGPDDGFGGTWTTILERDGVQTRVTVTERGEVYNPLLRFLMKYAMGPASTVEGFLTELGDHFGQDVEILEPGD